MNIVRMDDYDKSRKAPDRGGSTRDLASVLARARGLAAERLEHAIKGVLDQVDDSLFDMADKAENNQIQSLYFDAMREVRLKRSSIEAGFGGRFREGFDDKSRAGDEHLAEPEPGAEGLGLVATDELEERLAVTNMVERIRDACHEDLLALDQRIGRLLGQAELSGEDDPLGPETICNAFRESCAVIESGIEVRLIVLKLFERFALDDLQVLYHDLNELLIEEGILPTLPARRRKPVTSRHPARGLPAAEGADGPGSPSGEAVPIETGEGAVLALMSRLLGTAAAPGGGVVMSGGMAPGAVTGTGPEALPGMVPATLGTLTLLQQGDAGAAVAGLPGGGAGLAGLITAERLADGRINVLRDLQAGGLLQTAPPSERMLLDVVAMMFDYILADASIPGPIKALIGRLQIPILKAALLDRGIFSRRSHPARRLLDTLARAAAGWNEAQDPDHALLHEIARVVHRVLEEFVEDLAIFGELLDELERFLAEQERRATQKARAAVEELRRQERLEHAIVRVDTLLCRRLEQRTVPEGLRAFLDDHWRNHLVDIYLEQGDACPEWRQAVKTMDVLIWSTQPKPSPDDRGRLSAALPELIRRLNQGMQTTEMPGEERQALLAELAAVHMRLVRGEPPADSEGTPGPAGDDATEEAREHAPAAEGPVLEEAVDDEHTALARGLRQGSWVEFSDSENGSTRARLTWISAITGTYLFTDRQGNKVADLNLEALAARLREGSAAAVEDTPLFDQAVTRAADDLRERVEGSSA